MMYSIKKFLPVKRTLSFILKEVFTEKPILFVLYILRILFGTFGTIQSLILQKLIIDQIALLIKATDNSYLIVFKASEYILLTLILDFLIAFFQTIINSKIDIIGEFLNAEWNTKLNKKAMSIAYEYTESAEILDKLERAKEGKDWYSGGVVGILNIFFDTIQSFGIIASVFILILKKCPYLIPIQIFSLVITSFIKSKNNKVELSIFKDLAKNNRIFHYYFFTISDYKVGKEIRLFNCKSMFIKKMRELTEKQMFYRKNHAIATLKYSSLIEIINSLKDFISFALIGFIFITKKLSIGDFVFCINSATNLFNNADSIIKSFHEILKRSFYVENFISFMEFQEPLKYGIAIQESDNHGIEFKHVSFKYPNSNEFVLKNVNISFSSGETLGLVGINGSGKTTFIKLLCRLYDVTEGEILLDGINIKNYNIDEYRKLFSVIFQDFKLFAFSLEENICLDKKYTQSILSDILRKTELTDFVKKLSSQENTYIEKGFEENGIELSGGQKQKVAIARAYYKDSPVFIMDEPAASLDYISEEKLYNQINENELRNNTKILISHRLYSCKFCKRIIVFNNCSIIAIGTHKELLRKNILYKKLFYEQAKNYGADPKFYK